MAHVCNFYELIFKIFNDIKVIYYQLISSDILNIIQIASLFTTNNTIYKRLLIILKYPFN